MVAHCPARHKCDAEPSLHQAERARQMADLVGPVESGAALGQSGVDKRPVAARASDRDDTVVAQLAPRHLLACRQGMVMTAGEHERILHELCEVDLPMRGADEVDAEIRLTASYGLQPFVGAHIEDADADPRVTLAEPSDRVRQEVEHGRRNRREPRTPTRLPSAGPSPPTRRTPRRRPTPRARRDAPPGP